MLHVIPFILTLSYQPIASVPVVQLDAKSLPANLTENFVKAEPSVMNGLACLKVQFHKADWPNVYFKAPDSAWDWSASTGFAVDAYNPEKEPVPFCVRVDNEGADGVRHCNTGWATASPGKWTTLTLTFNAGNPEKYWGMRGIPGRGPLGSGAVIDTAKITAFQVFLPKPDKEHTLFLSNFRLFGDSRNYPELFPFIDKFGQYKHDNWPGKLRTELELAKRKAAEEKMLKVVVESSEKDRYGGWAGGPRLKATGWFRTERYKDKWWLVTPDGHLFFSIGMDCVGTWEMTFIDGRDNWFDWIPDTKGEFAQAHGGVHSAHSWAESIGGRGRVFSFYRANLIRKYGKEWERKWRDISCARLKAWGFNTIGNWSAQDVMENGKMPFVATIGVSGDYRRIEGGGGYWAKMPDVYDPKYKEAAEKSIAPVTKRFAENPYCIGYFVDNELAWEAIEKGTLASPPDQPCRVELVKVLQKRYGSLDDLNRKWQTSAKSWDELRAPDNPNETCKKDLNDWVYTFSKRYFEIVKAAVKKNASNQLYLGCRFAWSHKQAIRACADVADVVSFNIYRTHVDCSEFTGNNDLGKPVIIGEFHFGALDRGMFHQGLVPAKDQNDRAASYVRYVKSVAECPSFVGCHWFQYVDEPVTGRYYDGENYNIGFVDVTDTPYPEMVEAAKKLHADIYKLRSGTAF